MLIHWLIGMGEIIEKRFMNFLFVCPLPGSPSLDFPFFHFFDQFSGELPNKLLDK